MSDLDDLLAFARGNPGGFDWEDVEVNLGWPRYRFAKTVPLVRQYLKTTNMALPCTPQRGRGPWTYKLTSEQKLPQAWVNNRFFDMDSRLSTMLATGQSMVNATKDAAKSKDGRRARVIVKGVGRLLEDLREIEQTG
ncbi:MAG: hypothetical protein FWC87_00035 [Acidimicrobiaceae bacterium]|nr:hypothetical protein [Acidimicrobiaceae bacterium]